MKAFLALAAAAAFATTGCAGSGAASAPGSDGHRGTSHSASSPLTRTISEINVVSIRDRVLDTGALQVMLAFENVAPYALAGAYSFTWYDRDGFPIRTTLSNWQNFTLASGEIREVVVTGPGEQSSRYTVAFRKNDN